MKRIQLCSFVLAAVVTLGCGSSSDAKSKHDGDNGAGGGASSGGSSSGGAPSGATGGTGSGATGGDVDGGGGAPAVCKAAPAGGGVPRDAVIIGGPASPDEISARCDGSFAVSGASSGSMFFKRKDGSEVDLPDAPLWVAGYGADGAFSWAGAVIIGDGQSTTSRVLALADGSTILYGGYGTSAVFDPKGAHETKLPEGDWRPAAFAARYGSDGTLKWAKRFAKSVDSGVTSAAPAPDGGVYLMVSVAGPDAVGDGVASVAVTAAGVGVIEVDADGHETHGVSLAPVPDHNPELAPLENGGVTLIGATSQDPTTIVDAAGSTPIPPKSYYMARFDPALALTRVDKLVDTPDDMFLDHRAGLLDGSVVVFGDVTASVTVGHGDATEQKLTAGTNDQAGVLARYDAGGHLKWAKLVDAVDGELILMGMTLYPDDAIWLTGVSSLSDNTPTASTVVLGFGAPDAMTIAPNGSHAFVARFDGDGKIAWGLHVGGPTFIPNFYGAAAWPGGVIVSGTTGAGFTFAGASPNILSASDIAMLRFGP